MVQKYEKAEMLQRFRDAEIDFSESETREGLRGVSKELATLTFSTRSACGMVKVVHNGASQLIDVVIAAEAMERYDSQRMAGVIERTIRNGESAVREVLRRAAGGSR